jgi:hypothetical protein
MQKVAQAGALQVACRRILTTSMPSLANKERARNLFSRDSYPSPRVKFTALSGCFPSRIVRHERISDPSRALVRFGYIGGLDNYFEEQ